MNRSVSHRIAWPALALVAVAAVVLASTVAPRAADPLQPSSVAPTTPALANSTDDPTQSPTPALSTGPADPSTGAVVASPSPMAPPSPTPGLALSPPPAPGPFAMDLYEAGDFVHEAKPIMCVPAAVQTMVNIMSGRPDTTAATQARFYALARKLSPKTLQSDGAEPEGWARALRALGYGTYAVSVRGSVTNAIHAAARALRLTGKPVGLLVWYGAHSWVMSGFKATADPALTDQFSVTAVYIEDVWYPSISSIWGRSRPPDALVPVDRLPRDFLPWRMPGGPYPDKAWKFVTVVPVVPAAPSQPAPGPSASASPAP